MLGNVKVDMLLFTRTHYNVVDHGIDCRDWNSHSRLITTRHRQGPWVELALITHYDLFFCKIY